MSTTPRKSRDPRMEGLGELLPGSSSRWIQSLPRGRMRWPMVLERASIMEKSYNTAASWRMVEEPAFVACLAGSTLFVAEQGDGSWALYDAANMHLQPEIYGLGFEEARQCAVLVREGIIDYWCAFSRP